MYDEGVIVGVRRLDSASWILKVSTGHLEHADQSAPAPAIAYLFGNRQTGSQTSPATRRGFTGCAGGTAYGPSQWSQRGRHFPARPRHADDALAGACALLVVPPGKMTCWMLLFLALAWIIDRYQVKTDKASGIINDPNDWCDEQDDPT